MKLNLFFAISFAFFSCVSCRLREFNSQRRESEEKSLRREGSSTAFATEFYFAPETLKKVTPSNFFKGKKSFLQFAETLSDTFVCFSDSKTEAGNDSEVGSNKEIEFIPMHDVPISLGEFYQELYEANISNQLKQQLEQVDKNSLQSFAHGFETVVQAETNPQMKQTLLKLFKEFLSSPTQEEFQQLVEGTIAQQKVKEVLEALAQEDYVRVAVLIVENKERIFVNTKRVVSAIWNSFSAARQSIEHNGVQKSAQNAGQLAFQIAAKTSHKVWSNMKENVAQKIIGRMPKSEEELLSAVAGFVSQSQIDALQQGVYTAVALRQSNSNQPAANQAMILDFTNALLQKEDFQKKLVEKFEKNQAVNLEFLLQDELEFMRILKKNSTLSSVVSSRVSFLSCDADKFPELVLVKNL